MAIRNGNFEEQDIGGGPGGGGNNPTWGPIDPTRPPTPTTQEDDFDENVGEIDLGPGA